MSVILIRLQLFRGPSSGLASDLFPGRVAILTDPPGGGGETLCWYDGTAWRPLLQSGDVTVFGRSLLTLADAAAGRSALSIPSNLATGSGTAGRLALWTGAAVLASGDIIASTTAQGRTALGIGSLAAGRVLSVDLGTSTEFGVDVHSSRTVAGDPLITANATATVSAAQELIRGRAWGVNRWAARADGSTEQTGDVRIGGTPRLTAGGSALLTSATISALAGAGDRAVVATPDGTVAPRSAADARAVIGAAATAHTHPWAHVGAGAFAHRSFYSHTAANHMHVAHLPPSGSGTFDGVAISVWGGAWTSAMRELRVSVTNRGGLQTTTRVDSGFERAAIMVTLHASTTVPGAVDVMVTCAVAWQRCSIVIHHHGASLPAAPPQAAPHPGALLWSSATATHGGGHDVAHATHTTTPPTALGLSLLTAPTAAAARAILDL